MEISPVTKAVFGVGSGAVLAAAIYAIAVPQEANAYLDYTGFDAKTVIANDEPVSLTDIAAKKFTYEMPLLTKTVQERNAYALMTRDPVKGGGDYFSMDVNRSDTAALIAVTASAVEPSYVKPTVWASHPALKFYK